MGKRRVLAIREDDRFSEMLRENGYEVVNIPAIRTEPLADLSELDRALANVETYDGLFFTSWAAAEIFAERSPRNDLKAKIYVLGSRSADVLTAAGYMVTTDPQANNADELLDSFGTGEFEGKRLLFIRGERSMRTIPERLGGIATVDEVVVYRTVENNIRANAIPDHIDWICFFSPSGIESFADQVGFDRLNGAKVAAIGTTTAAKAREAGLNVDLVSPASNAEGFAKAIIGSDKEIE
ncbi:MAG: uroporphyrinogen-III synthase [Pyrinomonadaceae bacterium]|nr:uroporphyrinogen-III synthase [Pyrinomonadaceae bacterium]